MSKPLAFLAAALCAAVASAQPLRTPPTEKLTVNPGFRDWSPAAIAGSTLLAGNRTGTGGLFAIDTMTGKLKWSHRPTFPSGTASVSTPPAVTGDVVITPYAAAYPGATVALALATGKELWRGPDPAQGAAAAANAGLAYILSKNGTFYALDADTGREKWKVALAATRAGCASRPIIRDDTIYLTAAADSGNFLFAFDANTGQERWRYRAEAPYVQAGVCLRQPVVTADTIFAAGEMHIYAVNRATGRDRWKPIEIRRPVEGQSRAVDVYGLVDAGPVVIGITSGFLIAFDQNSGQTAWELPGQYNESAPSTAVAGNVLYFQGSRGTLHALDLGTHRILWSFTRPTAEPNWAFGTVTPFEAGLWVDSYKAMVKLQ